MSEGWGLAKTNSRTADSIGFAVIAFECALVIVILEIVSGAMPWQVALFLYLVVDAILSLYALWFWRRPRTFRSPKQYLFGIVCCAAGALISLFGISLAAHTDAGYYLLALFAMVGSVCIAGYARQLYIARPD